MAERATLQKRLIAAQAPQRTLRFPKPGKFPSGVDVQRSTLLERVEAVYRMWCPDDPLTKIRKRHNAQLFEWGRSKGGNRLLTAQDWIGFYDGATSRYFLLLADGSSLHTWLGEDYGHAEFEVDLVGPESLDAAVFACFS